MRWGLGGKLDRAAEGQREVSTRGGILHLAPYIATWIQVSSAVGRVEAARALFPAIVCSLSSHGRAGLQVRVERE